MPPTQSPYIAPANGHETLARGVLFKILEHSYDEIFVTDANGKVIYVNPVCERYYGIKARDVIGRQARSLAEEGYYGPPLIDQVLQQRQRINMVQTTNIGKTLLITATPVFGANGELEMVVQNSRDISGLEMIRSKLEDANRLVQGYREEIRQQFTEQLNDPLGQQRLVAHSPAFRKIMDISRQIAPYDSNVILLGESGTGKGALAHYIHESSHRREGPFITINCAAIPNELIEAELFGYAGGAFTGARQKGRIGRIELANGGTLFLDELAELPLNMQAKLLEAVQDRQFLPVGGMQLRQVDIRIISATNRNLYRLVEQRRFRRDLYHRLKVIELEIPPLRDRREDILPLIYFFLDHFDRQFGKSHHITDVVIDMLLAYKWPGNIRELKHLMEFLAVMVQEEEIGAQHLPAYLIGHHGIDASEAARGLDAALESLTRRLIRDAYNRLKSSYKVGVELNISQSRASRLIRQYAYQAGGRDGSRMAKNKP